MRRRVYFECEEGLVVRLDALAGANRRSRAGELEVMVVRAVETAEAETIRKLHPFDGSADSIRRQDDELRKQRGEA
jgi:hypothetical protein